MEVKQGMQSSCVDSVLVQEVLSKKNVLRVLEFPWQNEDRASLIAQWGPYRLVRPDTYRTFLPRALCKKTTESQ